MPKKDRSKEPRTKIEAEYDYMEGGLKGKKRKKPRKPIPKPEKEPGAVTKFGRYLKGKLDPEGFKSVDKYYKEKWKTKDLQEQIKKKKKLSKIERLKAEGRRLRDKKK